MKIFTQNKVSSFFLLLFFLLLLFTDDFAQQPNGKYTIVVHGGAGFMDPNMDESLKQAYLNSLTKALKIGQNILSDGRSSLDAVEQVVRFLEDDSLRSEERRVGKECRSRWSPYH